MSHSVSETNFRSVYAEGETSTTDDKKGQPAGGALFGHTAGLVVVRRVSQQGSQFDWKHSEHAGRRKKSHTSEPLQSPE